MLCTNNVPRGRYLIPIMLTLTLSKWVGDQVMNYSIENHILCIENVGFCINNDECCI